MKFSDGERLIITMLCELYDANNVHGEIDHNFIKSAIEDEQTWAIPTQYPSIIDDNKLPKEVETVFDIFSMWEIIELSYEELSDEDKSTFKYKPFFKGFDGNNEGEYFSTALFIINKLNRYEHFKGRDLNSHSPSVSRYERMLNSYKEMRRHSDECFLTTEHLRDLLG